MNSIRKIDKIIKKIANFISSTPQNPRIIVEIEQQIVAKVFSLGARASVRANQRRDDHYEHMSDRKQVSREMLLP